MNKNKTHRTKQLFFDVNETLLDLSPLKEKISETLGGGPEVVKLWFTTMLQYSLVNTVGGQYRDFGEIGAACLQMVARNQDTPLSREQASKILQNIRSLPAHADVPEGLSRLKDAGYKLAAFTNSGKKALEEQMSNSGLKSYFDQLLSVEDIGLFKPDSRAYSWAARKMGMAPDESMMIAAHGWDIAGAKWAGWQAAYVSRPGQQLYPLAEDPDIIAPDFGEIANELIAAKG
jgi:2-haloacid dehalogenase